MTIYFKQPEPPKPLGLSADLDGRVLFLKQRQGFWICAEDNPAELVTVHVAVAKRVAIVDDMDELTYDNLQGAFAV
jgi:hypothetical protein